MKQKIILMLTLLWFLPLIAQEDDQPRDLPVRSPFASGYLIDNFTTVVPSVKTLEYLIQHKFGSIDNGLSDLFGLYAPGANIRMALSYVPVKNLQLGYGLSRINMFSDFSIKYTILEQTRRNTVPVAVGFYGNIAIDGRNETGFMGDYRFIQRLAYFSQLIVGRRFNDFLSLQANVSYSHFNYAPLFVDHDKISVGLNGRINISPQSSILFQYDQPLQIESLTNYPDMDQAVKPNIGLGWEIRTSTHAFHIYLSSTNGMIPQYNALYNMNDFTKGDIMFGFTITRMWSF